MRDLPQELPVMAGLAESGLRNLRHPADPFFGFFGMHSIAQRRPVPRLSKNPELQLRWFADTAVAVRQRAIAEGDEDFGDDSEGYGLWIADVERPAPENRDGYQPYFDDAEPCSTAPAGPTTTLPTPGAGAAGASRAPPARRDHAEGRDARWRPAWQAAQAEPRRRVARAAAVTVGEEATHAHPSRPGSAAGRGWW